MSVGYRIFWQQFRRDFHATGSIIPSGRALGRALTKYVRDPAGSRRILEVGPGTGAVTQWILDAMHEDDRLDLVELNPNFVAHLRQRFADDPRFQPRAHQVAIHNQPVESLAVDSPQASGGYDLIVSGLPLNNFAVDVVVGILGQLHRLLKPEGTLSFFEYVGVRPLRGLVSGRAERRRLRGVGQAIAAARSGRQIHRDLVLRNVPPAWVHHLRNPRCG